MASYFAQVPVINAQLNCIVIVYMQIRLNPPQKLLPQVITQRSYDRHETFVPGVGVGRCKANTLQLIIICRISTSFDPS